MLTRVGMRIVVGILLVLCLGAVAEAAPAIHVSLPSTGMDEAERACHADAVRKALQGVDAKSIDVSVAKLTLVIGADKVEVTAEINVVISTTDDQIRTLGSGTAKFSVARRQFRPHRAVALRGQALGDALEGISKKLRA